MVKPEVVLIDGFVTYKYFADESTVTEPTPSVKENGDPPTAVRFPELTLYTKTCEKLGAATKSNPLPKARFAGGEPICATCEAVGAVSAPFDPMDKAVTVFESWLATNRVVPPESKRI